MRNHFLSQDSAAGFTLLEVILVISTLVLLAGLGTPIAFSNYLKNNLHDGASTTVAALRFAHTNALAGKYDAPWGVKIANNQITVFQGPSFDARNDDFDTPIQLPGGLSTDGISEVVFAKITGTPNQPGDVILGTEDGDVKTITINEFGILNY